MSINVNSLDPHVWPTSATRDAKGSISVAGIAVNELAAEFGTPLFVIDACQMPSIFVLFFAFKIMSPPTTTIEQPRQRAFYPVTVTTHPCELSPRSALKCGL